MFPAYGYNKLSYPQVRPQMSADCRRHPLPEGIPPQMKMEAANSPFVYESWPHHYGYPAPTHSHSCCSHIPYPSYYPYIPPPYSHFPPSYGSYPVYPEPYYTMELPKYEYDKNMPKDFHCCGCSHHKPDMIGDKGVKIEEHESDAMNKEESLVPAGFNNLQQQKQPIVWVPSDYLKNTNPRQSLQSSSQEPNGWNPLDYESIRRMLEGGDDRRVQDQKNMMAQQDSKRIVGQEPMLWSGWMPLDMDNLKRLLQNGDLKKDEDDKSRKEAHQVPFPMMWLPHINEQKGQVSDKRQQPLRSELGDDLESKGKEEGKLTMEKSEKAPRIIHVKRMDESANVETNNGMKAKNVEESTEKDTKSNPSSPTKTSRLPPVCLRVDPLPKKKNGQRKSRSPSPPRDEVKLVEIAKPSSSISENKAEKGAEENVVEMAGGAANAEVNKLSELEGDEKESKDVGEKLKAEEAEEKKPEEEAIKPAKRILSGTEAATLIQSAYRGHEVRRWEPLKKMRQIASICKEAAALRRNIESCAESMELKQKTALGETIMNLLLKLDTIQGLHSSVRDIRKSVAKELVNLQEMLDTTVTKKLDNFPEETKAVAVEATTQILEDSSPVPDMNEAAEAKAGEPVLQTEDESSPSSGLSKTEDQGTVESEESSSLHELSAQEPYSMPELLADEMTHEKERKMVASENDATSTGEEVGKLLLDSPTDQNEFDVVEEAAIKNEMPESHDPALESVIKAVDQESSSVVVEGHVGSLDQAHTNHDLLDALHVAVMEEDVPKTETSQQVNIESGTHVTELNKLQESDEALIGEVTIQQDDESIAPEKGHVLHNDGDLVDPSLDDLEVVAKPVEEDVKLIVSSVENNVKEDFSEKMVMEENEKMRDLVEKLIASGKEQQEVILNLNEKLKELEDKLAKQKLKKKNGGGRTRKARVLMCRSSNKAPKVLVS